MGTLGRAIYGVGYWIRATGQALDRLGVSLQGSYYIQEQDIVKASMELRCVQCGSLMEKLYIQYSPGNIRLIKCSHCKAVADEYIECESMIILIDLILHKPKAYRHLLFNTHNHETVNLNTFLLKSSALFLLLDAYKLLIMDGASSQGWSFSSKLSLDVLLCTLFGNSTFVCVLTILSKRFLRFVDGFSGYKEMLLAIFVSSYLKLFMVAMAIWEFPSSVAYIIDLIVMSSNLVALDVITESSIRRCMGVCFGAHGTKLLITWMLKLFLCKSHDAYLL